jgi:hypothetical protein
LSGANISTFLGVFQTFLQKKCYISRLDLTIKT